jgi:hypothetical protein
VFGFAARNLIPNVVVPPRDGKERLDPLTRARVSRPRSPARLTLAGLFLLGDSGVGWSRMYAQPAPFFIENKEVAVHFLLCRSGHPLSMAVAKYAASQPRSARQQHLPNEVALSPFRRDGRPRAARVSALRFAEAEKAQSTRRACDGLPAFLPVVLATRSQAHVGRRGKGGCLPRGAIASKRPTRYPVSTAGSTGRCNTGVKSLCWGFECQGLPWPFV